MKKQNNSYYSVYIAASTSREIYHDIFNIKKFESKDFFEANNFIDNLANELINIRDNNPSTLNIVYGNVPCLKVILWKSTNGKTPSPSKTIFIKEI